MPLGGCWQGWSDPSSQCCVLQATDIMAATKQKREQAVAMSAELASQVQELDGQREKQVGSSL